MSQTDDLIKLKLINGKYLLQVFANELEQAKKLLQKKFQNEFLTNQIVINSVYMPNLTSNDKQSLIDFMSNELNVNYDESKPAVKCSRKKSDSVKFKNTVDSSNSEFSLNITADKAKIAGSLHVSRDYRTKVIKSNLRSGTSIHYDGNIMVIGDVNAGAELVAKGNIIVLGTLRGLAVAGSSGDKDTFIIAHNIKAVQVRIASAIAIPPNVDNKFGTQMAYISDKSSDIIQIQQLQ